MPPNSSLEIVDFKEDSLMAILPNGTSVYHTDNGIVNSVFNSWIYFFNDKYLSKKDIIYSSNKYSLVDIFTDGEVKVKINWKASFIATRKSPSLLNKNLSYVKTSKDAQYNFGETDTIINTSCDGIIKGYLTNFEKQYDTSGISDISRDDCIIYSQLAIEKNVSPKFVYPQNSFRIKSWEKLKVTGYAWPWSTLSLKLNWEILWTVRSNEDWFFSFISSFALDEVTQESTSTLYLIDNDQGTTTLQKIIFYVVPLDSDTIDKFPWVPEYYVEKKWTWSTIKSNWSFYDSWDIYNSSSKNWKKVISTK
jgi:hypothetical protein